VSPFDWKLHGYGKSIWTVDPCRSATAAVMCSADEVFQN
jgi:hypothetical protein